MLKFWEEEGKCGLVERGGGACPMKWTLRDVRNGIERCTDHIK